MQKNSCFVAEMDLQFSDKLKDHLIEQGFILSFPPHTIFSAKKKGVSCTLYESGKITVQGKDKHDFIAYFLEPEILKDFTYSYPDAQININPHIGMDEAGKGDLFGPLCVVALYADEAGIKKMVSKGIRDSKRLSDNTVKEYARFLEHYPHILIRIFPEKYNYLYGKFKNLNRMLAWAHSKALEELTAKTSSNEAIIDQFAHEGLMKEFLKLKGLERINLVQRPRAEEDPVVAAASILARNAFLEGLEMLSKNLGFNLPKGASNEVIKIGKRIMRGFGNDMLGKTAKMHFKSIQDILAEEIS